MHLEDARGRQSAHQGFAHLGRIGAGAAGEQQSLGHGVDGQRHHDLVGHLGGLAGAAVADQVMFLPMASNTGLTRSNTSGLPPTMIDSVALGADVAARDRRVEVVAAQCLDLPGEGLGLDRRDRRHVDHHLARREPLGTPCSPNNTSSTSGVSGTMVMMMSALSATARVRAGGGARVGNRRRHLAAGMDEELVAGLEQVARHRRAHDAEPDEADPE